VIALHGWFGHAGAWGHLPDHLDPARFSWAFLDARGYGARRDEAGPTTMDGLIDDALALADALGWDTFSVVGHSMGGMAALGLLARAPDRVRRVVSLTGVPATGYPFDEGSWGFFSAAAGDPEVRRAILDLTTGKRLSPRFIDGLLQGNLASSRTDAFAGWLTAWGKEDLSTGLEGLRQPVTVLLGAHDPAIPEALHAGTRALLPQTRIEVLENSGHYPMFEVPVALATALERALG
jgi:pimeloyl-ACP methyl ester carboxylesterase